MEKRLKILLIEDNPEDICLLQEILAHSQNGARGFSFAYADRLEAGIEVAKRGDIDIIVLDLTLPDSRGVETLTKLQSEVGDIPVVVLTALNDPTHAVDVVSRGAQDYLIKGQITQLIFTRTVLYALERHKIRSEHAKLSYELKNTNARLEKLILLDPLTNLLNRRGLQEALSREVERSTRDEQELMALILDMDNFKFINDSMGHAVGDVVLKEIAQKISSAVRLTDYVARIGGDEFLVLMPQTRQAEAVLVAEKIRRAVSGSPLSFGSSNNSHRVTASLGLVSVSPDTVSIDELMAKTHLVLYKSKAMGKNRLSLDTDAGSVDEISQVSSVLGALRHGDQYRVLKQPIYNLREKIITGYEFLSRFSVAGLELPDDFFRVCLENNILTVVDCQCLKNCVHAGEKLPGKMTQHLNIFPSTLIDIPIRNLVQSFGPDVHNKTYCVEISEQQFIGDPSYLIEPINALKESGIQIAIDDVGFGRSCLESIILLEPDIIKIDKKWVNGISKNTWCERSLKRLLKITDALGIELVAEGIETQEDMDALVSLGVKYGQGYLLGRPAA